MVTLDLDWTSSLATRVRALPAGAAALADILALASSTEIITFSGGFPAPETFPTQLLHEMTGDLLRNDPSVALQYSPTRGLPSVLETVAGNLLRREDRRPGDDELMMTSGGIDALELLSKSLLDPGDLVLAEAPTYLGALMAFHSYQARVVAVPTDQDGLNVEELEKALRSGAGPKFLYTIPDHQNPSGLTLSQERRIALVDLARQHHLLILEDVAYRELSFSGTRLDSLWSIAPDVVVQLGTYSKTFFPGIRLGWAVGPRQLVSRMVQAKQNSDQCAGAFGQRLIQEYMTGGHMDRQLPLSRALYARRAAVMLDALAQHMPAEVTWTVPTGGFFTWVTAPGVSTTELARRSAAAHVAFVPGAPFYPDDRGHDQMRLSFSRAKEPDMYEGVRRLADLLTTYRKEYP